MISDIIMRVVKPTVPHSREAPWAHDEQHCMLITRVLFHLLYGGGSNARRTLFGDKQ